MLTVLLWLMQLLRHPHCQYQRHPQVGLYTWTAIMCNLQTLCCHPVSTHPRVSADSRCVDTRWADGEPKPKRAKKEAAPVVRISEEAACQLIRARRFSREHVGDTSLLNRPAIWRALLDVGMPFTALTRNLGVSAHPMSACSVCVRATQLVGCCHCPTSAAAAA